MKTLIPLYNKIFYKFEGENRAIYLKSTYRGKEPRKT